MRESRKTNRRNMRHRPKTMVRKRRRTTKKHKMTRMRKKIRQRMQWSRTKSHQAVDKDDVQKWKSQIHISHFTDTRVALSHRMHTLLVSRSESQTSNVPEIICPPELLPFSSLIRPST